MQGRQRSQALFSPVMTAVSASASLLIKALIVTTGYVPTYSKAAGERIVRVELTGGRAVIITGNEKGYDMGEATKEEAAAAKPIAKHYKGFLTGGALPSAPAGITTTHHCETDHEGGGIETIVVAEAKEGKRLAALRGIVRDCQYKMVEGVLVDAYSASAFVQVYDLVSQESKDKLLSFDLPKAIRVSFATIKKAQDKSNA